MRLRIAVALVLLGIALAFAAPADARAVLNLDRALVKGTAEAHRVCKNYEVFIDFGIPFRKCEGWYANNCMRESLTRPDLGTCRLNFFMEDAARGALRCKKVQGYQQVASGIRAVSRRSTSWGCNWARVATAAHHLPAATVRAQILASRYGGECGKGTLTRCVYMAAPSVWPVGAHSYSFSGYFQERKLLRPLRRCLVSGWVFHLTVIVTGKAC